MTISDAERKRRSERATEMNAKAKKGKEPCLASESAPASTPDSHPEASAPDASSVVAPPSDGDASSWLPDFDDEAGDEEDPFGLGDLFD